MQGCVKVHQIGALQCREGGVVRQSSMAVILIVLLQFSYDCGRLRSDFSDAVCMCSKSRLQYRLVVRCRIIWSRENTRPTDWQIFSALIIDICDENRRISQIVPVLEGVSIYLYADSRLLAANKIRFTGFVLQRPVLWIAAVFVPLERVFYNLYVELRVLLVKKIRVIGFSC